MVPHRVFRLLHWSSRLGVALLPVVLLWGCSGKKDSEPIMLPEDMVVIEMTASDCHDCGRIHNMLQDLRRREFPNMRILTLSVTDDTSRDGSWDQARRQNAGGFFQRYVMSPGTVGVVNRRTGHRVAVVQYGKVSQARYREMIRASAKRIKDGKD